MEFYTSLDTAIRPKQTSYSCEIKKTHAWLRGVLYSLILCTAFSLNGQQQLDSHFFHHHIGTQVSVSAKDYSIDILTSQRGIYLDHGSNDKIAKLYIDNEGYDYLIEKNISFSWSSPILAEIEMKGPEDILNYIKMDCKPVMDFYPTYEAYEEMMYGFEVAYPDICKIVEIATLASGRKILAAQIGDNIDELENEPNFLYTSSMHGDELGGYPLMLMYIDLLLCNYGSDERVTDLVNGINIYINPLANPDGTYKGGNSTVADAIRFNDQFVDLNRNYLDPVAGENPDNRSYQEETIAFMDFAADRNIHLSCNIHGGTEVCNYPWDSFEQVHADDDWWMAVMRDYADTVQHVAPQGYLSAFNNGITNGFQWYVVEGGRQDYMTYYHRGREFTLEISDRKLPDASDIPDLWSYNKAAFLNYMEEATYGLRGVITDCVTGEPIVSEISIPGHDNNNSSVFSSEDNGAYFRYLAEGTYDVMITAVGYDTVVNEVAIVDKSTVVLDSQLCPALSSTAEQNVFTNLNIYTKENIILLDSPRLPINTVASMYNSNGQLLYKSTIIDKSIKLPVDINSGIYVLRLESDGQYHSEKIVLK